MKCRVLFYKKDPLEYFAKNTVLNEKNGCLEWVGIKAYFGYGKMYFDGKHHLAHRFSYKTHKGDIPKGMCVCHKCDNTKCVNPEHLFLGTQSENAKDMVKKGRVHSKLKENEVIEIYLSNKPQYEIAKKFGISQENVSCIKNGVNWSRITNI